MRAKSRRISERAYAVRIVDSREDDHASLTDNARYLSSPTVKRLSEGKKK